MERSIPDKIHKYPPNTPDRPEFLPTGGQKIHLSFANRFIGSFGPHDLFPALSAQSIDLAEREVKIDDWLVGLSLTSHYGLAHIGEALKCSPTDGLLD